MGVGGREQGRKDFTFNGLMLDQGKTLFLIGQSPLNKLLERRTTGLQTNGRSPEQNTLSPMSGHIYYSQADFGEELPPSMQPPSHFTVSANSNKTRDGQRDRDGDRGRKRNTPDAHISLEKEVRESH